MIVTTDNFKGILVKNSASDNLIKYFESNEENLSHAIEELNNYSIVSPYKWGKWYPNLPDIFNSPISRKHIGYHIGGKDDLFGSNISEQEIALHLKNMEKTTNTFVIHTDNQRRIKNISETIQIPRNVLPSLTISEASDLNSIELYNQINASNKSIQINEPKLIRNKKFRLNSHTKMFSIPTNNMEQQYHHCIMRKIIKSIDVSALDRPSFVKFQFENFIAFQTYISSIYNSPMPSEEHMYWSDLFKILNNWNPELGEFIPEK